MGKVGNSLGKEPLTRRPHGDTLQLEADEQERENHPTAKQQLPLRNRQARDASNGVINRLTPLSGPLRNNFDLNVINDERLPLLTSIFLSEETRAMGPSMKDLSMKLHLSTLGQQDQLYRQTAAQEEQPENSNSRNKNMSSLSGQSPLPPFTLTQDSLPLPFPLSSPRDLTRSLPRLSIPNTINSTISQRPNHPSPSLLASQTDQTPGSAVVSAPPEPLPTLLIADDSEMDTSSYPEFLLSSTFPTNSTMNRGPFSNRIPFYRRACDAHDAKAGYVEKKIRLRRQRRRRHGEQGHDSQSRRGSNIASGISSRHQVPSRPNTISSTISMSSSAPPSAISSGVTASLSRT